MAIGSDDGLVQFGRGSLIRPAVPTKRHFMYLSGVDQLLSTSPPSRTILFYRTHSALQVDSAVALLRRAIASALVPFYPMAGRLALQDAAEGGGRLLAVDCNDEGVQFIEARCSLSFAELERDSFDMRPLFRELAPMDDRLGSRNLDDPLAAFQVTALEGGFTVGWAVLHSVADGHATWNFIQAIAQAGCGKPLSVYPLHTRVLLKPSVFMLGTQFPHGCNRDEPLRASPYMGCEDAIRDSNPPPSSLHHKLIHFSQEMLQALKDACTGEAATAMPPASTVSTFHALGAYLWRRLTLAQALDDDYPVDFRIALDIRSRMIPPLTLAFFGNAVVGIPTPSTAKEILMESLADTAARIRESIKQGDDTYIKAALTARENKDLTIIGRTRVKVMLVRNASRFPVYEATNFGWGEAEAVRPPWNEKEGHVTWYPGKQAKSLDVIVSLSSSTYAKFFLPDLYPNDPLLPYLFAS